MLADGIGIEVLVLGAGFLLAILAGIAIIEALVTSLVMRLPAGQTWRTWLAANAFSALGGTIVLQAFGGEFLASELWMLTQLSEHGWSSALLSRLSWAAPRLAAYFVETLVVEILVWRGAIRLKRVPDPRCLMTAVFLGNATSYAIVIPLVLTL